MEEESKKQDSLKIKLTRKHIAFVVAVVLFLATVGFAILKQPHNADLTSYKDKLSFSVYRPTKLPSGYHYLEKDITFNQNTLFMSLRASDISKPVITLTQQSKPTKTPIDGLLGPVTTEPTKTKNGLLYIAETSSTKNAILVTDDSWILFSAPKVIDNATIESLVGNLVKL